MTKLKTLKDMFDTDGVIMVELKEEAIKWVKELSINWNTGKELNDNRIKARWIKEFFNITEDELKETKKGCFLGGYTQDKPFKKGAEDEKI